MSDNYGNMMMCLFLLQNHIIHLIFPSFTLVISFWTAASTYITDSITAKLDMEIDDSKYNDSVSDIGGSSSSKRNDKRKRGKDKVNAMIL